MTKKPHKYNSRINRIEHWFFEKTNKTAQHLVKLIKNKRENKTIVDELKRNYHSFSRPLKYYNRILFIL